MKLVKQNLLYTLIGFTLLSSSDVSAEWRADLVTSDANTIELSSQQVLQIEEMIADQVRNSWCSIEKAKLLFELVVLKKPEVCVEIGAFMGASTFPMVSGLKYNGRGAAFIIDAWSNSEAVFGLPSNDQNTVWWATLDMESIKNHFIHRMHHSNLLSQCHLLDMRSQDAITLVPSIDFLHLDGNFSEQGALSDCELYLPKVNQGGYILLSNVLVMIDGKPSKMRSLWPLFAQCDLICELENGNVLLFKKKLNSVGTKIYEGK